MAKHMFRCYVGPGKMSISDLETRIDDWVTSNAEWTADERPHELTERNTADDGSGATYYGIDVRFWLEDAKDNLVQKFEDKLKDKTDWYRVGYHRCDHDETDRGGDDAIGCPPPGQWGDQVDWTAKDVAIPEGVPRFR